MTRGYLGDSGIVLLGGDERHEYDDHGVRWQWGGNGPWSTSPAPRTVSGDNANDHGSWDATEFDQARRYALEGLAFAPDHEALHVAEQRFKAALRRTFRLRCIEPGFDRWAMFRRDGDTSWTELTNQLNNHVARFSVPLWAGDPRAYSTAVKTVSAGFPSTTGGLTWPATWPATWNAVVSTGTLTAVNEGNETAWPIWRIDGPVANPAIVNVATGEAMRFDITLAAGEWLTANTRTHQVLANGEAAASRRSTFYGDWFGFEPGLSTVRFTGQSGGPGAGISATYNDTSI